VAVINIFSPGWLEGGALGTWFVANPWGTNEAPASAVWLQCEVPWWEAFDTPAMAAFGILEVTSLDDHGEPQRQVFADFDLADVYPAQLPPSLFVPRFLGVILAMLPYNTNQAGTLTLFQFG
jgi:hypothetical protein